jgi:basic membrane protein A
MHGLRMPVIHLFASFCVLVAFLLLVAANTAKAAEEKKLNVGFVYVSAVQGMTWSWAHDQGRKALEATGKANTFFLENIAEGADSERAILNLSRRGMDVIFTTSFGFMEPTIRIAEQFPHIQYLHCSGYKTAENVSTYFGRMYQPRYLTGMVAGAMTKSNIIGYVAAYPIPEVIRGINAFTLGVRAVNSNAEVRVVWTRTWHGPRVEKEAAKSLLDIGADVIAQHQESPAPQEAARERGAWSIGYSVDMGIFAPDSHLIASVWNWAPFYLSVIDQMKKGAWRAGSFWGGMETGMVDISEFGKMVPENVRAKVLDRRDDILAGKFDVFHGPIKDQAGVVRVADGVKLTDPEKLAIDWFVEGVRGGAR